MGQWTLEQKTYLLKLLCLNRPLIKDLNMLLLKVKEQFSKKFDTDDSNISGTIKEFNEKINEFYDIQGLLKLELNDSNSSSGSSVTEEIKKNDNDEENDAKKQLKHVIIDEDKNKVFDESIEKSKELEPAVSKIETIEANIQDENPVIVNTVPDANDTPLINKQEQQEVTFDGAIKETKEETGEEEPVHLTRAQARKLHIDVVKEAEQNEKKTHDIEEARKQKSAETDDEISNALYSETDEAVKKPKSTGKIDVDNTTPRRSTRLRRKSNQGIDDVEIPNDHVGTRTRSVSATRTINRTQSENDNDDASDATDVKEVPRRGRRRKLIANLSENENDQQPQQSVRKTRSRKSSEFEDEEKNKSVTEDKDNESHADDEKEDNKTEEEDENQEQEQEQEKEQEQESSEEDADHDTTRLRRSSRKRKSESIEPQTPKKQKPNQPIPNTDMSKRRSKKIKNVSPTPNEAVPNVGDEEDQSVASRTRRR